MTDHAALLRDRASLEDDIAVLRGRIAAAAAFIHNPAWDRDTRIALAATLGLPGPAKEPTPCPQPPSPYTSPTAASDTTQPRTATPSPSVAC
ncbi:hypothetical protein Srufu_079060 (plasmid) [Streptomyces libani subsp. rufus]|nr:hypothetical protein Srufu_079060 [Streptomyces libani subsp. rufus]